MAKQYRDITRSISTSLAKLRPAIPDVTTAFSQMAKAARRSRPRTRCKEARLLVPASVR